MLARMMCRNMWELYWRLTFTYFDACVDGFINELTITVRFLTSEQYEMKEQAIVHLKWHTWTATNIEVRHCWKKEKERERELLQRTTLWFVSIQPYQNTVMVVMATTQAERTCSNLQISGSRVGDWLLPAYVWETERADTVTVIYRQWTANGTNHPITKSLYVRY